MCNYKLTLDGCVLISSLHLTLVAFTPLHMIHMKTMPRQSQAPLFHSSLYLIIFDSGGFFAYIYDSCDWNRLPDSYLKHCSQFLTMFIFLIIHFLFDIIKAIYNNIKNTMFVHFWPSVHNDFFVQLTNEESKIFLKLLISDYFER